MSGRSNGKLETRRARGRVFPLPGDFYAAGRPGCA